MDYTNLYSTRIQKTFDEDQTDIISAFRAEVAKNPKHEIQLINYYKGLPISYNAKIATIEKDTLDLDVTPQQAASIPPERYTFIRSKLFKHTILAGVQYVSVKHKALSVRKLCYVEILAERRKHVRLEIGQPLPAMINSSTGVIKGRIIELSLGGAVMAAQLNQEIADTNITLSIMIPDTELDTTYNVKLSANLVENKNENNLGRYAYSFSDVDKVTDRIMGKYLFRLQVEIIRELKDMIEIGTAQ